MDGTRDFAAALQASSVPGTDFVETKRGNGGGTFDQPRLATKFAAWLDVKFESFCLAVTDDLERAKLN